MIHLRLVVSNVYSFNSQELHSTIEPILCQEVIAYTNCLVEDIGSIVIHSDLLTGKLVIDSDRIPENTSCHEDDFERDIGNLGVGIVVVVGRSIHDLIEDRSHDTVDFEVVPINNSRYCNINIKSIFRLDFARSQILRTNSEIVLHIHCYSIGDDEKTDSRVIHIDETILVILLLHLRFITSKILIIVKENLIDFSIVIDYSEP